MGNVSDMGLVCVISCMGNVSDTGLVGVDIMIYYYVKYS